MPRLTFITAPLYPLLLLAAEPALALDNVAKPVIEEVVVSAQKRRQALNEVPISIAVLDSQRLANSRLYALGELSNGVANFNTAMPNGSALPVFSLRGISMADYSVNQSSPVSVYLDEIYLASNYSQGLALFDLRSVEILRGPQGTLYGKNSTGGAINLHTITPDFSRSGYLRLSAGNYNALGLDAAFQSPLITDVLAARLAISTAEVDGFAENHQPGSRDHSGESREAVRLSLNYQPNEQLSAILKLHSANSDPISQAVIPKATGPGGLDFLSLMRAGAGEDFYRRPAHYDNQDADSNRAKKTDVDNQGANLTLHWQGERHLLSSITGYYDSNYQLQADSDGTPQQLLEVDYDSELEQWSQEFRISSQQYRPLGYTAGIYFASDQLDTRNDYHYYHGLEDIAPGFVPPVAGIVTGFSQVQRYRQQRDTRAGYGEFNYSLGHKLTATAGLRYTEDKITQSRASSYIADYSGQPMAGLIPFSLPYDPEATAPRQQFTDREWTGTLKLDYQPADQTLLYASYSRGYRSGAFNGAAVNDPGELGSVAPETVNAWELGAKGQWLEGRLSYQSALFYYDYRDLQFLNVVATRQLLHSADRARVMGADVELQAAASERLMISLGLGFVDSEFRDGPQLTANGKQWDLSGNQLANAPEFNAKLRAEYRQPLASGELLGMLEMNYIDEQWFSAFNDEAGFENIGADGYSLINARLGYQFSAEQDWELALWGKNLSDEEYKSYAINLSESFGYHYQTYGAPRTYGVELSLKF